MPIIPQYRAQGGPAKPGAPAMEPVQRERVDAGEALRGMSRLSEAVEGLAVSMPGVPEDLGQASMRGIQNLGAGVKDLGQSMFDIRERVARAKSFADVSEAQLALDAEVGNFEEWRARNQGNPEAWEGEWATRLERFRNDYLAGKDFPPATQDAINQRVMAFGERHGISVGIEAVKATVGRARESLEAEIVRAVRAKDIGAVEDLTAQGVSEGWIPEDQAERMKWQAAEQIREDELSSALMRSDTYAMRGMVEEGRAEIASAPFESEDERQLKLAEFDTKTAVHAAINEVQDRLADGEDPNAIRAELEAKDEKGNFTAYRDLSPAARAQLLKPIYAAENEEYSSMLEGANGYIESGVIKTEKQLEEYFGGMEVDPLNRAILGKKLRGEVIATEKAVIDLQAAAAGYDPEADPDGRAYTAQMNAIYRTLEDDPRAADIVKTLTKRRNGESLTLGEDIFRVKAKEVTDLRDAVEDYRIPAGNLVEEERDGRTVFVDYSQAPEPGDPARFEKTVHPWFGKPRTKAGRVVTLSQEDREKMLTAKDKDKVFVTDLNRKAKADSETAQVLHEMKRRADTGEVTTENWKDEYRKATAPMRAKVAEKEIDSLLPTGGGGISSGLFPATKSDPEADLEWLNSLEIP